MTTPRFPALRTLAVAALVVLLPAGAIACSDSKSSSSGGSTKLSQVKVAGSFGEKPTFTFPQKFVGSTPEGVVVSKGTGPAVEAGQRIKVDYVAVSGDDGSELESTYGVHTDSLTVSKTQLPDNLYNVLVGTPVGSRERRHCERRPLGARRRRHRVGCHPSGICIGSKRDGTR